MPSKQQSRKRKAHTIDEDVREAEEGIVGDTPQWQVRQIMNYRYGFSYLGFFCHPVFLTFKFCSSSLSPSCVDRRLGKRMVFLAVIRESHGDDEHTLEPLTNLIGSNSSKHMGVSFLEKQGLELVVDRITKESWVVKRDEETNSDPSDGPRDFR